MAKIATKAASNVFYQKRLAASKWNDKLASREGASDETGIDRTRIANIELGTINPYPEEVMMFADAYNAPELKTYYCKNICSIGRDMALPTEVSSVELTTVRLLRSLSPDRIDQIKSQLLGIADDGIISDDEKPALNEIIGFLDDLISSAMELKLLGEKAGGLDGQKE